MIEKSKAFYPPKLPDTANTAKIARDMVK